MGEGLWVVLRDFEKKRFLECQNVRVKSIWKHSAPPAPSGSSISGEATRAGDPLQSFRVLNPLGSWDYITIQRLFLVRKEGQTTLPRMCKA